MGRVRLAYKIIGIAILLVVAFVFLPSSKNEITPIYAGTSSKTDNMHPVITFTVDASVSSIPAAFEKAKLDYYPQDHIQAFPDPSQGLGSIITVSRAMPVTIVDGRKSYIARSWATTVKDLFTEQHINLGDQDQVNVAPASPLVLNENIKITRVERTTLTVDQVIPFQTIKQDDSTMYRGEQKTAQVGENGEKKIDHLIIRKDGELESDTVTGTTIVKQVINEIIKIGTKLKLGVANYGKATYYENNLGTKVASDKYKKGTKLLVTNQNNGKSIEVVNDGCICGNSSVLIDLNPSYFQQLGGTLGQGVLQSVKVEEILN